MIACSVAPIPL
ncbi:BgTH12-02259 [Blumeria graminis f. sp. triticale]|uniref:BgTH12-02259 n=1 Tax=Blumeria graminis f. sp. triticale TaxID=1689686 RepID=A0A9W4DLC8_BLUGR|nr:BgTH12-02259 [Blumeria graminis f. sp. triticale]